MNKYGFIGLGDQGGPIARRMVDAGLPTVLWARRPQTLESFANTRAEIADSIEALAKQVDYVGICVVDDAGVEDVCNRLIPSMHAGALMVIHSTVHPALCAKLAVKAAEKNISLIDAPVSGGGMGAAAGTLSVMVGGDSSAFNAARPVFETFAKLIVHMGAIGAGQQAKLINNAMLAANIAIAHWGGEGAKQLGLDRDEFIRLIKASSGHSFGFDVAARMTAPNSFTHGADLMDKIRLLGELLGDVQAFTVIRDAAGSFLGPAHADL